VDKNCSFSVYNKALLPNPDVYGIIHPKDGKNIYSIAADISRKLHGQTTELSVLSMYKSSLVCTIKGTQD
jgi:hypothetical protein